MQLSDGGSSYVLSPQAIGSFVDSTEAARNLALLIRACIAAQVRQSRQLYGLNRYVFSGVNSCP